MFVLWVHGPSIFGSNLAMDSSSVPSKHVGDPHKSKHRFVATKISKKLINLISNVFGCWHNCAENYASNRETEVVHSVGGSAKIPEMVCRKYSPLQKGMDSDRIREKPTDVGTAQINSMRWFWFPSVHFRFVLLFLLWNTMGDTFSSDLWRSRNNKQC